MPEIWFRDWDDEDPIHVVLLLVFEPGSLQWKARIDTTSPNLPPELNFVYFTVGFFSQLKNMRQLYISAPEITDQRLESRAQG